jgi:hypothetical protein
MITVERFTAPTDDQMDRIETSRPRTVARRGDTYTVIHGPPLPRQGVEFCTSTAAHLRAEAKRKPNESAELEALAIVYDRRTAP